MPEIKSIWTEEIHVRSFETDLNERWKPACFFQNMQETATHHASHFGFDYQTMLSREQIWLISRVKIRFIEFPRLGDRIIVRTWPKGIKQKVFFMRDFQFDNVQGKPYAVATTAWILVNPGARRMLLPSSLKGTVPDNDGLSALEEPLEKINLPDNLQERLRITAGYSSVDLMGHVNNARYIEWISDSFPFEPFASRKIDWLQVNYNHEVRAGENISILSNQVEGNPSLWAVAGVKPGTSVRAFEALLGWGNEVIP